jgi:excisionase family DNA binding protein
MDQKTKDATIASATYTLTQAAKLIGIGRTSAYEAARRGEIPCIKIGSKVLVPRAALHKMLGLPMDEQHVEGI